MAAYPQPTRESTIKAILDASDRSAVPIRGAFIQGKDPASKSQPGPLSALVRRGRNSTLEQYLLLHAWASGGRFDVRRDSRVWARALGLSTDEAGRRTVGRNWKILSELGLVDAHRVGREVCATLLKEDGSGLPYRHPHADGELYLQLDYKYWAKGYHERLTVPGKAVLLIALTLGDWFSLPTRRGPEWYGISRSTLERGFRDARRAGVMEARFEFKEAPLAPEGYTRENYYRLMPPFGPRGRIAKSAHPIFSLSALKPSAPPQEDRPTAQVKRRKPAAGRPEGEARRPGARQKSSSRPRRRTKQS
jgi:DNA-binding transcriptional ArsR family regulator